MHLLRCSPLPSGSVCSTTRRVRVHGSVQQRHHSNALRKPVCATSTAAQPSSRPAVEVTHCTPADAAAVMPRILDTMRQAFTDDGLQRVFGIPEDKRHLMFAQLAEGVMKCYPREKVLYYAAGGDCACILLTKQQSMDLSLLTVLSAGLWWTMLTVLPLWKVPGALDLWDRLKQEEVALQDGGIQDYLKVVIIGTHPSAQGRGLGSAVLRAISARADAAGLPLYLEASSRDSARLYARQGYEEVKALKEDSTEFVLMVRPPTAGGAVNN